MDMPTVKVGPRHQITIPQKVFEALKLRVGDFLDVRVEGHKLSLIPKQLVPKSDAWFYSKEWQQGEKEVDEALKKGEVVGPFDDIDEALKALKK
jgi:AbrB family looped-hinge helix DNA binding protein